ncbi:hypothetical protein RUESEDTHA_02206 [Ruegeria sp. THAF57]|uniref:hypothetical protein n=1 Tax=Ruegeria sp. THAF57 TaxID=2744555 RepID=UPI0015DFBEAC|nr:hypothetical protein [Ruegeria sp. THAF57]CAD0185320.1 hypothetical protein RUESEDTHA_02206 [Ruegeria sp. THAF57]
MARTLKDLLLALLNATLILVALCLFLGWKLASTVEGITTAFAENIQIVAPLKQELQGVRGELAALRSDLSSIQIGESVANSAAAQKISTALAKLDNLEKELQAKQARISELTESPDELINTAIEASADAIADRIIEIRGCVPAS